MKKTLVLAAACLALGACSHRQTRQEPVADRTTTTTNTATTSPAVTDTTASGSSSSLGAVSSGRGH